MPKSNLKEWLKSKKLIVIHWLDAASQDSWHNPKEAGTAQECISCGILLDEDDTSLTLTHTFGVLEGKDADTCCSISIPKGCVIAAYEIPSADSKIVTIKPRRKRQCKK